MDSTARSPDHSSHELYRFTTGLPEARSSSGSWSRVSGRAAARHREAYWFTAHGVNRTLHTEWAYHQVFPDNTTRTAAAVLPSCLPFSRDVAVVTGSTT